MLFCFVSYLEFIFLDIMIKQTSKVEYKPNLVERNLIWQSDVKIVSQVQKLSNKNINMYLRISD